MLDILFEDNHLLAVNKPVGLATMGVAAETESVLNQAKQYLKERYNKPGNVYLGVVSRLDSVASGVLVFARTSKAAARLSEQFASRRVEKTYWAIVGGNIEPEGELLDWVYKDEPHKRMAVAARDVTGAQQAQLRYRLLRPIGPDSLVEVELITGRKHQIRLQFAARGHAIRGDKKYGSTQGFASGIALHARRLVIEHPTLHSPVEMVASLPLSWRRLGISS
jgi:23S rRNA pseudouridine1911/1915/1917 synthase